MAALIFDGERVVKQAGGGGLWAGIKDDRVCAAGGSVGASHTEQYERLRRSLPDGVRRHGIDVAAAPCGALGGTVKHQAGGGGPIRGLHQPGPLKIPEPSFLSFWVKYNI